MLYALAEHMCEKFGTCTGDSGGDDLPGISAVNGELLSLWRTEQAHLEALEYNDAAVGTREIVPPMAVPLVQGLLRYVLCVPWCVVVHRQWRAKCTDNEPSAKSVLALNTKKGRIACYPSLL